MRLAMPNIPPISAASELFKVGEALPHRNVARLAEPVLYPHPRYDAGEPITDKPFREPVIVALGVAVGGVVARIHSVMDLAERHGVSGGQLLSRGLSDSLTLCRSAPLTLYVSCQLNPQTS